MKNTWWKSIVLGAGMCAAIAGWQRLEAQTGGGTPTGRVAVVDIVRIFNEYERQKDLETEMKQLQERLQLDNQQRRQRLEGLDATVSAMDSTDPNYAGKMKELFEENLAYKNWMDLKQAGMAREIAVWTERMYKEITATIGEVAQRQGIDCVLYKDEYQTLGADVDSIRNQIRARKVLYANPSIDITSEVLTRLNETYRAAPRQAMLQL